MRTCRRAWLGPSSLHLRLANNGPGYLPSRAHAESNVKFSRKSDSWSSESTRCSSRMGGPREIPVSEAEHGG
jgi:hypothetical protein